jgi:hypothetical protein
MLALFLITIITLVTFETQINKKNTKYEGAFILLSSLMVVIGRFLVPYILAI